MEKIKPGESNRRGHNQGFTLVEILVAMAMSAVVIAAIYTTYSKQQEVNTVQGQVVQMQQNLRAGMFIMSREIRMAGYDPKETGLYGITAASASSFAFTADVNDDGGLPGVGESFQYELIDSDGDGTKDALRRTPADTNAVANDIYQLNFVYVLSDGTLTSTPTAAQLSLIRSVQISLLARASLQDKDYRDTSSYPAAAGVTWGPYNDKYRRRFVKQQIALRNMGL